jgi:hypothetical protein
MSKIIDFLSILGADQLFDSARANHGVQKNKSHDENNDADKDVYSSFDVEDIYDEEYDEVIDEEWD